MMKKTYPHDRHSQPGVAVFRPDLHRLRQGSAGSGFGMDELLSALCFAARAAVWNHVENAVRGTQQPAIFDRQHPWNHERLRPCHVDREHQSLLHTLGLVVRQLVLNPRIMSACAGALAAALHIHPPVAINNTLLFLQNAATPVALFVLGVTVALRPFGRVPWEVPGVIAVKLLIHPLMVFVFMLLLGPFAQPWAATAVLIASLPPALNVFVIARQNDSWIEPASVAVLIGTFASVVTLTSMMWLIQTGRLAFP